MGIFARMSTTMNAFLLVGSREKILDYVNNFKNENNIPHYFMNFYEEFKISDARMLQKSLSGMLPEGSKKVFVVSNPTVEAQNAMLKMLEELSRGVFIFFAGASKEDFLPTILSRCKQINLGGERAQENEIEEEILRQRDRILSQIKKDANFKKEDFLKLKKLVENNKLVKFNNVNKKLALDNGNFI